MAQDDAAEPLPRARPQRERAIAGRRCRAPYQSGSWAALIKRADEEISACSRALAETLIAGSMMAMHDLITTQRDPWPYLEKEDRRKILQIFACRALLFGAHHPEQAEAWARPMLEADTPADSMWRRLLDPIDRHHQKGGESQAAASARASTALGRGALLLADIAKRASTPSTLLAEWGEASRQLPAAEIQRWQPLLNLIGHATQLQSRRAPAERGRGWLGALVVGVLLGIIVCLTASGLARGM